MKHSHIINILIEYHKRKKAPFKGCILINPEEYEDILKENPDNIEFIDSSWTFRGLPLVSSTDEDIAWMAFEFTGWSKDNPELLAFLDELEFRELLYKDLI